MYSRWVSAIPQSAIGGCTIRSTTEHYMGLLDDNKAGYDESSPF
jgi:hypothetical protein